MYVNYLKKSIAMKGRFFPAYSFVINRDGVSACVSISAMRKLAGIPYYVGVIYCADDKWRTAVFRQKGGDLYNVGSREKPMWVNAGTNLFSSFDRKIKDEKYKNGGKLPCPLFAEAKAANEKLAAEKQLKDVTPVLQRNLNTYEYIPMGNTRYELSKQNADNADYGVAIGTDTPVYASTGKTTNVVGGMKHPFGKYRPEQKAEYAGPSDRECAKRNLEKEIGFNQYNRESVRNYCDRLMAE